MGGTSGAGYRHWPDSLPGVNHVPDNQPAA